MSDHVVLSVDHLIADADPEVGLHGPFGESTSVHSNASADRWGPFSDEEEAANEKKQCRICHEEDDMENLEAPCSCNGTMKLAHKECIARWIAEKLDNTCEICHQPFEGHFALTPPPGLAMDASDEVVGDAIIAAEIAANQIFDGGYDECATAAGDRTAFIRASILIPAAFMMLKHANETLDTEDQSIFNAVNLFFLHLVTVLAPIYVMSWFIHQWLCRREKERARLRAGVSRGAGQGLSAAAAPPPGSNESPRGM